MKTPTEITCSAPADALVLDASEVATMRFAGTLRSVLYWFRRRSEKPEYGKWARDYLKTIREQRTKLSASPSPLLRLEAWQVDRDYFSTDFETMPSQQLAARLAALQQLTSLMPCEDPRHFDVRNQRESHTKEAVKRFLGLHVTPVDHLRAA